MNVMVLKMRNFTLLFAVPLILTTSGCAWTHSKTAAGKPAAAVPAPIVTPDFSLAAKVVSVNTVGRFVVLSFPVSQMPNVKQTLFLYRGGLKVAEVRVTGPQQDSNIIADLTYGEAQVGDTVRDQ